MSRAHHSSAHGHSVNAGDSIPGKVIKNSIPAVFLMKALFGVQGTIRA